MMNTLLSLIFLLLGAGVTEKKEVHNLHYLGERFGGGIVFFTTENGTHGLIAATADFEIPFSWYNGVSITTKSFDTNLFSGAFNTKKIISLQGNGIYAAEACANYREGGYYDWYLPSRDALNLLFLNKGKLGHFKNENYWSSTEYNTQKAICISFHNGSENSDLKYAQYFIRPVRSF